MQTHEIRSGRTSLYGDITDRIVRAIETGAPRFEMPWHRKGGQNELPANAATGRTYRGVNIVSLWAAGTADGFETLFWATYRQWKTLDAQVRKGERGVLVVFYSQDGGRERSWDDDENEPENKPRFVARASWVFNADQVDGWRRPAEAVADPISAVERADTFVAQTGAAIRVSGTRAYYRPSTDQIQMPSRHRFTGSSTMDATEAYYATLLHELTHWTGHPSRLKRDLSGRFGEESYAMEELVAELGAAFLCAELGVTNVPRPDHAAYINGWLTALKRDMRAIFVASTLATAAANFLKGEGSADVHDMPTEAAVSP